MLHSYIDQLVDSTYSDGFNQWSNDDIAQCTYATAESMGANFDDPTDHDFSIAEVAFSDVCGLVSADEGTLNLMECIYNAEQELGVEFSQEDLQVIQDCYEAELDSQDQFSDEYDPAEAAVQTAFSLFQSKHDDKFIRHRVISAAEALGIYKNRSKWQKFKDSISISRSNNRFLNKFRLHHKPTTTAGKVVDTATNIVGSPIGQLIAGGVMNKALNSKYAKKIMELQVPNNQQTLSSALTDLEMVVFNQSDESTYCDESKSKKSEKTNKKSEKDDAESNTKFSAIDELDQMVFTDVDHEEATEIHAINDAERAEEETNNNAPVSVESVIVLEDFALPTNTIVSAEPAYNLSDSTKYGAGELLEAVNDRDKVIQGTFADELADIALPQDSYSLLSRVRGNQGPGSSKALSTTKSSLPKGYFDYGDHDKVRVGVLGAGSDFRDRLNSTYAKTGKVFNPDTNQWETTGFGTSKYFSKDAPSFWNVMKNSALDAIAEGMITGAYYQSLDTGLNVSAGTVRRVYQGTHSMLTPVFDNLQKKLESAGSQFANWISPDGASATDIINEMTDQDANEIIKTLDSAGWLSKLPEAARNRFLMNLSKSGCCYIDEKGTLKKRALIDSLVKAYSEDVDRFMEILPQSLKEIEDIYKTTALISHDSINTESIYNRLKTAKSVEQVRSILDDEFNVIKKPLVSLRDLTVSLSNDFITLMKSDKTYFKSLVSKIAHSIALQVRDKGASEITTMADAFLKRLSFADTEVEIRRATEVLVVANIKYLESELGANSDAVSVYSESDPGEATVLNVDGNINMENSPVKPLGDRTMLEPANLGAGAGWTEKDMLRGDIDEGRDPLQDVRAADNLVNSITNPVSTTFSSDLNSNDFYKPSSGYTTCEPGFGVFAL